MKVGWIFFAGGRLQANGDCRFCANVSNVDINVMCKFYITLILVFKVRQKCEFLGNDVFCIPKIYTNKLCRRVAIPAYFPIISLYISFFGTPLSFAAALIAEFLSIPFSI